MNEPKMKGLLGLSIRARQAASGMDACRKLISSGKCGVLLMDEKTGFNTRKKTESLCRQTATPFRVLPEGLIGTATGREHMVMAISKGNFAAEILKMTESTDLP